MTRIIRNAVFLALGIMLFASAQAAWAAPVLSARTTGNPFPKIAEEMLAATSVNQLGPIIIALGKNCKELELPDTNGCPDMIASLKNSIKTIKSNPTEEAKAEAFELEINAFVEAATELGNQFELEYGGDERAAAEKPAKMANLLKADSKRALQNPFDQLIDWVNWWDNGSFYPKTVRSNAKFGAPKVNKFIKNFCDKLEIDFTDGCGDVLKLVKSKIKKNSKKPELNVSRREIIDTYLELLGNLSESFENRYGGDDRTSAAAPDAYAGGDPFAYKLTVVEWWDLGSFFPATTRIKFAPKMVNEIAADCLASAVYDEEGCGDEISVLKSKLKNYPKKKSLNNSKEGIVDTFKEVLGRLSEDYAGKFPEEETSSDEEALDEEAPLEEEEEEGASGDEI